MSNGESFYTFVPWLRTGVGAQLANSPTGAGRASVNLKLLIDGDDQLRDTVDRPVELYGPGDIVGLNTNTIIRTVPPRGAPNFEANFLAAIEFYDEDFPWRYSPVAPGPNGVAPWLWLLVLEAGEFDLLPAPESGLPIVRLHTGVMQTAFPKADQSSYWAHAHLNFQMAASETADLESALRNAGEKLTENPNLGCSRLICPRRLKEDTAYTTFLIPAFEKGRLAGLGAELSTIDLINSSQLSWQPPQASPTEQFPIYYQWSFSTMKGGDFEDLASKITPVKKDKLLEAGVGVPLKMDIHSPGWGVDHKDSERTVEVPSVFRLPGTPAEPEFPAPTSANDNEWSDELAQLLNLAVEMQDAGPVFDQTNPIYADDTKIGDDPVVTPPQYGSWYVPPSKVDKSKMKTDWFQRMNLHPSMRVIGGLGAEVIRDNQEEYMERAWEQYEEIRETNRFINLAQLSSNTSKATLSKHLSGALASFSPASTGPSNQQVRGLRLASMSQTIRVIGEGEGRQQAFSLASPVAMKMFRPNGALMNRLGGMGQSVPDNESWLKAMELHVFRQMVTIVQADLIVMAMTNSASITNHPVKLASIPGLFNLQSALETHKHYFRPLVSVFLAPPKVRPDLTAQFQPGDAIAKKVRARIPLAANIDAAPKEIPLLRVAPEFKEPMFDELARQSLDFVMPGVDKFPVDRCAMFDSDRSFVEAFLVGLNHEMAREMLWREFPTNLKSTFFSHFWDKSDAPVTPETPNARDIRPITEWDKPSVFGHGSHFIGAASDPLFFVLRGDLLRKYPNTVVFMQPAKLDGNVKVPDDDAGLLMPIASARVGADIFFVGFDVSPEQAKGEDGSQGYFIGLQERPGDIHFGLDRKPDAGATAPAWTNSGVEPGHCVDLKNGMPLFANLTHAADVAVRFYQQPVMVLIHASSMLP